VLIGIEHTYTRVLIGMEHYKRALVDAVHTHFIEARLKREGLSSPSKSRSSEKVGLGFHVKIVLKIG